MIQCYAWDFEGAAALAARAVEISPAGPLVETACFAGALAAIHLERDEEAIAWVRRANAVAPALTNTLRIEAAALARLGRAEEARAVVARILALDPAETVTRTAALNPIREWPGFGAFVDALRAAGLPE
jgi:Flp pilus assembly protein TadD